MLDFKKNRKSNLVIVTLIVSMIILLTNPMISLAAVDTSSDPIITCVGPKPGAVNVGTELEFNISDPDGIKYIWYQWDLNLPGASELVQIKIAITGNGEYSGTHAGMPFTFHITGTDTEKNVKVVLPFTEEQKGKHELHLAAMDMKYNMSYLEGFSYYITTGLPDGYVDNDPVKVTLGADYPVSGDTVDQYKKLNFRIEDEGSGIDYLAYKFSENEKGPYDDDDTIYVYDPANEQSIPVPTKPGFYYFQFYAMDNAQNLMEKKFTRIYVTDQTNPTIALKGEPSIIVPVNSTIDDLKAKDQGAVWTDNTDGKVDNIVDGENLPENQRTVYANNLDEVDLTKPGKYTLKYMYTDNGGNKSEEITREVLVDAGKTTYELTLPNILTYNYRDNIDLTGATVKVIGRYGEEETIEATIDMFTNFSTETVGQNKKAIFKYGTEILQFNYTVNDIVSSIDVTTNPTKTVYEYGEEIDLTGGKLQVSTESGATSLVDLTEATVEYEKTPGEDILVTVTYKEAKAFFFITINPKAINVKIDSKESEYKKDLVELTYSLAEGSSLVGEDKLGDIVSVSTTATSTSDAGEYAITGTVNDAYKTLYNVTFNTDAKYVITQAKLTAPTVENVEYVAGKKLSEISLGANWKWADSVNAAEVELTVGKKAYEAVYTGADAGNYSNTTVTVEFEVTPTTPVVDTVQLLKSSDTYTSNAVEIAVDTSTVPTGLTASITKYYKGEGETKELLTNGAEGVVGAGKYTVEISFKADSNHTAPTAIERTFEVLKATLDADDFTKGNNATYNGQAQAVTVSSDIVASSAITVKYDGATTIPTNAGTYAITVDVAETDNYNAIAGITLGNYTINKKTITVSLNPQTVTYTGSDITVNDLGLSDENKGYTLDGILTSDTENVTVSVSFNVVAGNVNASETAYADAITATATLSGTA